MKAVAIAALFLAAASAHATCTGSSSIYSCTDSSGNTYNVNRIGQSTYVQGHNSQTGSSWSQQTQRIGNSSFTTGRDADGNSWSANTIRTPGGGSMTYGSDRNGRSFTRTCNQFGCF